jgi:hypothetical protein
MESPKEKTKGSKIIMKAQIESTTKIITLVVNGAEIPARIWEGRTEKGVPCHFFVTRVAVANDQDKTEFTQELQEHVPPTAAIARTYGFDPRLIL